MCSRKLIGSERYCKAKICQQALILIPRENRSEVDPNYRTTGLDRKKRFDRSNYNRFEHIFLGGQRVTEATQFQSVF